MFSKFYNAAIDYILPHRCIACSNLINDSQGICITCFHKLHFISTPFCYQCGFPFEFQITGKKFCANCIAQPPYYDLARSLLKFDLQCKKLIHAFKYNDKTAYAKIFAKSLITKYRLELQNIDILVPVPMHRLKRIFRYYNPAQILALELSKILNIPMIPDLLIKTKWTKSQITLTRTQRKKNLADSIKINPNHTNDQKNILLIDDVRTTGTTANYCARLLKKTGAKYVMLITIAMV